MRARAESSAVVEMQGARPAWYHVAPHGITKDDVLHPEYWMRVATMLRRGRFAVVEVVAESGDWEVLLRVEDVDTRGEVTMSLLREWNAPKEKAAALPEGFRLEPCAGGYRIRRADGASVGTAPTKAAAVRLAYEAPHGPPPKTYSHW
ncbi:MAG: hypothetical protein J0I57_07130 [Hyphomicrobium sp.]|nr:hypothetical protein [Hyphomicrobium sp.]